MTADMTLDPKVLQQAVELVGWQIGNEGGHAVIWYPSGGMFDYLDDTEQFTLDALAAELVRLVDAMDDQGLVLRLGVTETTLIDRINRDAILGHHYGIDRTENTINAIVEFYNSGVTG